LDMGVDGLRLDAIPYIYEREGTSCENLPETHEYLKTLRKHVDERYGNQIGWTWASMACAWTPFLTSTSERGHRAKTSLRLMSTSKPCANMSMSVMAIRSDGHGRRWLAPGRHSLHLRARGDIVRKPP